MATETHPVASGRRSAALNQPLLSSPEAQKQLLDWLCDRMQAVRDAPATALPAVPRLPEGHYACPFCVVGCPYTHEEERCVQAHTYTKTAREAHLLLVAQSVAAVATALDVPLVRTVEGTTSQDVDMGQVETQVEDQDDIPTQVPEPTLASAAADAGPATGAHAGDAGIEEDDVATQIPFDDSGMQAEDAPSPSLHLSATDASQFPPPSTAVHDAPGPVPETQLRAAAAVAAVADEPTLAASAVVATTGQQSTLAGVVDTQPSMLTHGSELLARKDSRIQQRVLTAQSSMSSVVSSAGAAAAADAAAAPTAGSTFATPASSSLEAADAEASMAAPVLPGLGHGRASDRRIYEQAFYDRKKAQDWTAAYPLLNWLVDNTKTGTPAYARVLHNRSAVAARIMFEKMPSERRKWKLVGDSMPDGVWKVWLERALADARLVVSLDPDNFKGWHMLATLCSQSHQLKKGLEAVENMLRIQPNNRSAKQLRTRLVNAIDDAMRRRSVGTQHRQSRKRPAPSRDDDAGGSGTDDGTVQHVHRAPRRAQDDSPTRRSFEGCRHDDGEGRASSVSPRFERGGRTAAAAASSSSGDLGGRPPQSPTTSPRASSTSRRASGPSPVRGFSTGGRRRSVSPRPSSLLAAPSPAAGVVGLRVRRHVSRTPVPKASAMSRKAKAAASALHPSSSTPPTTSQDNAALDNAADGASASLRQAVSSRNRNLRRGLNFTAYATGDDADAGALSDGSDGDAGQSRRSSRSRSSSPRASSRASRSSRTSRASHSPRSRTSSQRSPSRPSATAATPSGALAAAVAVASQESDPGWAQERTRARPRRTSPRRSPSPQRSTTYSRRERGSRRAPSPPPLGDTNLEELDKVKQRIASWTCAKLRAALAFNNLSKSGAKAELQERVTQAVMLGVLPSCPECVRGKLRRTGTFVYCPGWFDNRSKVRQRCPYKVPATEVDTIDWRWPSSI